MKTVILALGANVGNRKDTIEKAIVLLRTCINNLEVSSFYETKAKGFTDQPNFLNTAIKGKTHLKPPELLEKVKGIEKILGRKKRFRWGPREIDIDVIFLGQDQYNAPDLEIPHSHTHLRDFVLAPIVELDEEYMHPVFKKTVKQLLHELPDKERSIVNKV